MIVSRGKENETYLPLSMGRDGLHKKEIHSPY